ncbi:MAG: hypothetical protein KF752_19900 [Pirellulaceae bacterium]|nr:hypothetical protein [Pirellulaceae bacterium]
MSNDKSNLVNVIAGTFFGALAGGGIGLGACMFLFDDPPFFTGDTILIGAIVCGVLGFFLGAGFIEWLKENWWGFWCTPFKLSLARTGVGEIAATLSKCPECCRLG